MKNILRLIIIVTIFVSCDNKTGSIQSGKNQLDSLINFDTITTISLYGPEPKFVNEQPLNDSILILSETMFIDSTTFKWTNSSAPIEAFRNLFPRLIKVDNQVLDSSYNFNELLIVGKNTVHTVTWIRGKKDSLISFDGIVFKTDKVQLKKAWSNLDRPIVIKV